MTTDYYQVLGVSRDATGEEIKRAYRRLAREMHPDVNPDRDAQDRFKTITAAYEVLSDPAKRQVYDLGGDPLGGQAGGFRSGGGFGFGDIMDAFFGPMAGGRHGPKPRQRRGDDSLIRLEIDLREAAFGTVREITIDTSVLCGLCAGSGAAVGSERVTCQACRGRGEVQTVQRSFLGQVMTSRPCTQCAGFGDLITAPCPDCVGEGRIRTRRTLTVKIPAGVDTGTRIQLAGEGECGPGGGPPGDLYVEILERPDPVFERQGDDLHCTISIPMTAAALGATIKLETLDGPEAIEIKAGTQPGSARTLRGRGVTHLRGAGRGDLHAHIVVTTPTKLTGPERELLEQLAALRGEENPDGQISAGSPGLFARIRDAFAGR